MKRKGISSLPIGLFFSLLLIPAAVFAESHQLGKYQININSIGGRLDHFAVKDLETGVAVWESFQGKLIALARAETSYISRSGYVKSWDQTNLFCHQMRIESTTADANSFVLVGSYDDCPRASVKIELFAATSTGIGFRVLHDPIGPTR